MGEMVSEGASFEVLPFTEGFVGCVIRHMDDKHRIPFPSGDNNFTWNGGKFPQGAALTPYSPINPNIHCVYFFPRQVLRHVLGKNPSGLFRYPDIRKDSTDAGRITLNNSLVAKLNGHNTTPPSQQKTLCFVGMGAYCIALSGDNIQCAEQTVQTMELSDDILRSILHPVIAEKIFQTNAPADVTGRVIDEIRAALKSQNWHEPRIVTLQNLEIGGVKVSGKITFSLSPADTAP